MNNSLALTPSKIGKKIHLSPTVLIFSTVGIILIFVAVGGAGTIKGALVAAIVLGVFSGLFIRHRCHSMRVLDAVATHDLSTGEVTVSVSPTVNEMSSTALNAP